MGLPSFQQLMLPQLNYVCQRFDDIHISRIEEELAKALKLSAEDVARILPSGQQSVFANRLNWARSYLLKACLIDSPRRGYCRGTERARNCSPKASRKSTSAFSIATPNS
jgi:restriction system protein